jgi:hypothetical protein
MKLARTVSRFEDFVEEFDLNLDLTNASLTGAILCPFVDDINRTCKVEILDVEIGKIRVTITRDLLAEFKFNDVYAVVYVYKLSRTFNPLNVWLSVSRTI